MPSLIRPVPIILLSTAICLAAGPDAAELPYLVASDGVHGAELWRSDGTPAGTALVADVYSGTESFIPTGLVPFGDRLAVWHTDGVHGWELWALDAPLFLDGFELGSVSACSWSIPR